MKRKLSLVLALAMLVLSLSAGAFAAGTFMLNVNDMDNDTDHVCRGLTNSTTVGELKAALINVLRIKENIILLRDGLPLTDPNETFGAMGMGEGDWLFFKREVSTNEVVPFALTKEFESLLGEEENADTALSGRSTALYFADGTKTGHFLAAGAVVEIDAAKSTEDMYYIPSLDSYAKKDALLAYAAEGETAVVNVKTQGVYLRARPDIKYEPLCTIDNGATVRVLAKSDLWALVTNGANGGYCALSCLD